MVKQGTTLRLLDHNLYLLSHQNICLGIKLYHQIKISQVFEISFNQYG